MTPEEGLRRIAELQQQLDHEKWLRQCSEEFCQAVQDQRDRLADRLQTLGIDPHEVMTP